MDSVTQKDTKTIAELLAGGINSVFEIVPAAGHVMTELVGKGFMQKLEKLH